MIYLKNNLDINIKIPSPVKKYTCGKTGILIYENSGQASLASCLNVVLNQIKLVNEKGSASLMLMAAPSAYEFYRAYIDMAESSRQLQAAIKNTHYLQMDEYILPQNHTASFKHLLKSKLFNHIDKYICRDNIHYFSVTPENIKKDCRQYRDLILELGPDIQIKGQGEDGHWGFHQPYMSFDTVPQIVKVRLNIMNMSQQLRDHPDLYDSINQTPSEALTANVPLFMKPRVLMNHKIHK